MKRIRTASAASAASAAPAEDPVNGRSAVDSSPVVSDDDDDLTDSDLNGDLIDLDNAGSMSADTEDDAEVNGEGAESQGSLSDLNPEELYESEEEKSGSSSDEESGSSSDEETNPVGDIPMRWYEGFDHVGYSRDGKKIARKERKSALERAMDPHAWRTVYDEKNDEEIVLTHEELKEIAHIRARRLPGGGDGSTDEFIAWSGPPELHPLTSAPEPKRRFLPSKHEALRILKLVKAMRAGRIPKRRPRRSERDLLDSRYNYDVWAGYEEKPPEEMSRSERIRSLLRIPAPKLPLPTNYESYNPPEEYLPTKDEKEKWEKEDERKRERNYLSTKHDALRHVPLYGNYIKEQFERCLDLYLAVRVRRERKQIDPDDLIPDLPDPRSLRPYPTGPVVTYGRSSSRARTVDVNPGGQWLVSGHDDGRVRLWEIATGYLRHTFNLDELVSTVDDEVPPVTCVSWCPQESGYVFGAVVHRTLFVMSAAAVLGMNAEEGSSVLEKQEENSVDKAESKCPEGIQWKIISDTGDEVVDEGSAKVRIQRIDVLHPRPLRELTWHYRGDYVATVGKDSSGGIVAIHRLSRRASQVPFRKKAAAVQLVRFHPSRPFFFVATLHHVRIYNLAQQVAVKTLKPGVKYISSIAVHPSGDHVLVASYDKRVCWFDLDLSTKPYKTIQNHRKAVRAVSFHPRLPLWADAADDGSVHVFHGRVYDDLTRNPTIVPLKKIQGLHRITQSLGVLDLAWHPRMPWLFSSGADCAVHMLADLT